LTERRRALVAQLGVTLDLAVVAVKHPERPRPVIGGARLHGDAAAIATDPSLPIVIEASGAPQARDWLHAALARGAVVVTAHKQALANDARLLQALADRHPRLFCEAAVAAAVPIIRALGASLGSDDVKSLRGVLNGTTTYVLSRVEGGDAFDAAVNAAQAAGYAEQDPSDDLSGRDAAAKLAILSTIAWREPVSADRVATRGIDAQIVEEVHARPPAAGHIRLVAQAYRNGGIRISVAPSLLAPGDPLADAAGVENVIEVEASVAGRLIWRGPGAGGRATASALLADTLAAAQTILSSHGPDR
ncbi:MAG: homoserine dehydrogenase, partial [Gemmatimonadetes bacterium]|nr:homoserine dehydrogenase [Gemmatimonadota bacterium]